MYSINTVFNYKIMFTFQTTAGRVVNREGLRFVADKEGIITTESSDIATIFANMGFVSLDERKEVVVEINKQKKNAKV
jgi:hypothetical protein